jgi:hypothetical protein
MERNKGNHMAFHGNFTRFTRNFEFSIDSRLLIYFHPHGETNYSVSLLVYKAREGKLPAIVTL